MTQTKFIERKRTGLKSSKYFQGGQQIKDTVQLERFKALRIPPAWKDVKISTSPASKVQVTGYDNAGRLQYIYNPNFRAKKEKEKFERVLRFANALPRMRRVTAQHLNNPSLDQDKVMACILRLIDSQYFRVGNEIYAKENQSYGITTMRSKHTKVKGDTIVFDFVGKSGKKHIKEVTDKRLARIIKKLDDLPGYEVFKFYGEDGRLHNVNSEHVNEYIKKVMGEEFSAKDFRTWGGTVLASAELAQLERAHSEKERQRTVAACVKKVAARLGNTPAIARSSYIDPRIINTYIKGNDLFVIRATVAKMERKSYLNSDEQCLLYLLEKAKA
jgi:DNA topoisomerase-1